MSAETEITASGRTEIGPTEQHGCVNGSAWHSTLTITALGAGFDRSCT